MHSDKKPHSGYGRIAAQGRLFGGGPGKSLFRFISSNVGHFCEVGKDHRKVEGSLCEKALSVFRLQRLPGASPNETKEEVEKKGKTENSSSFPRSQG